MPGEWARRVLLIGIKDDGTVTGARPRHEAGRTDPFRVQALVANMTQPPISVVVNLVAGPAVVPMSVSRPRCLVHRFAGS